MMEKKEKELLSEEEKRTILMGTKVNQEEAEKIKFLAEKCGMTVSRYMRESALGNKIYYPLTPEDQKDLAVLKDVRVDIVNYGNALKGLSQNDRKYLFDNTPYLRDMWPKVWGVAKEIKKYLNAVYERSKR